MSDFPVVIPARGGSKGISRKNLQTVGGLSLLYRAIKTALAASWRVYVSTEDEEIARYSRAVGASVIDRPPELATDDVQVDQVYQHAWEALDRPEITLGMQVTAPWVTPADVRNVADAVKAGADMAVLAVPFHGILWSWPDNSDWQTPLRANVLNRDPTRPVEGRETQGGQWLCHGTLWGWRDKFLSPWYAFNPRPVPAELPLYFEIDEPRELELANRIWSGLHDGNSTGAGLEPASPGVAYSGD